MRKVEQPCTKKKHQRGLMNNTISFNVHITKKSASFDLKKSEIKRLQTAEVGKQKSDINT